MLFFMVKSMLTQLKSLGTAAISPHDSIGRNERSISMGNSRPEDEVTFEESTSSMMLAGDNKEEELVPEVSPVNNSQHWIHSMRDIEGIPLIDRFVMKFDESRLDV